MGVDRRSFPRDALAYIWAVDHWIDVILAAIGGYAAALFAWEATHRAVLPSFLLKNALPLEARRDLALLLIGGVLAALVLWPILGWALARFRRQSVDAALHRSARLIFLATLLPFLPILAIPGLEKDQPFFVFGAIATLAALTFIAVRGVLAQNTPAADRPQDVHRPSSIVHRPSSARTGLILTLLLAAGYALFMSALSVARHNGFMTHAFDLGIQDQVVHNILHSGQMVTTLLGPTSRVYDHFSPVFFLVAPIYAFFQDARTLLVLQSLFLGIGAIPLYLLAKDKLGSSALALALAMSYLLYPALHGVNLGDFHQIAFACGALLFALYFLETGRDRLFLIALGVALLTKEEVALSVAAIGVYTLLAKRRWRLGLALTAFGLAYFVVVVNWLMPLLGSVESAEWRYAGFLLPGKGLLQSFFLTFLTNPLYPFLYVFSNQDKLIYLAQLFLPVLFLPVLAPFSACIAALPALLLPLLTVPQADYGIRFHYSAHVTPFVFFLAVLALQRLGAKIRRPAAIAASILVASLAMSYQYGQIIPKQGILIPKPDEHSAVIQSFFPAIPPGVSVSTMSDLAPHLSSREAIYLFPVVADAEYLFIDTTMDANYWPYEGLKARSKAVMALLPQIQGGQFGLVRLEDGVMLLKRGSDTGRNDEAVKTLFSAHYEAEDLSSDLDAPAVPDPQASKGQARLATPASLRGDGKTALVFGPYADLPPGKYRAEFILKTDRNDRADRIATVDVFTHKDGYPRAVKEILGTDFAAANRYQPFAIEFESDKPLEDLEFRVQYGGVGTLGLDAVQVTPVELWLR